MPGIELGENALAATFRLAEGDIRPALQALPHQKVVGWFLIVGPSSRPTAPKRTTFFHCASLA
jgi:hypothetical protein